MDQGTTHNDAGIEMGALTTTLEEVWADVRERHSELPPVVIIVASGAERGRVTKWGHWARSSWKTTGTGSEQVIGEIMIAGEALAEGAETVLMVLLHEAAHALNTARGIKDCTRQGRYHNKRFQAAAVEVGLACSKMDPFGWAKTTMDDATRDLYQPQITMLNLCLQGFRMAPADRAQAEREAGRGEDLEQEQERREKAKKARQRSLLECGCETPRKIRMSPATADLGPVLCGLCGQQFARPVDAEVDAEDREDEAA